MSENKKIGGEYGEVRANIDVEKLNAYLVNRIPGLSAPVAVKQFKVRSTAREWYFKRLTMLAFSLVK